MGERITITIDTGNAAFDDSPAGEVALILRNLAAVFARQGIPPERLRDSNGNTCGSVRVAHLPAEEA